MKASIFPAILLAGTIIVANTGCKSRKEGKEVQFTRPDVELVSEFTIVGYSGPPPGEVNQERYQEIADAFSELLPPAGKFMRFGLFPGRLVA